MSEREHSPDADLGEVEARLSELRRRKQVRWSMSRRTAEMAIAALALSGGEERPRRRSAKSRRRKRGKRLL